MDTKKIRLAIFDIDDTLIKRGKLEIETSAINAIRTMEENGIEIMVATGRAYFFIHDAVHREISPDYYVTTNGACVYNKRTELVFKVPMDKKEVTTLIDYARINDLAIAIKMKDNMPVFHNMEIFKTVYMQGSPKQHILSDRTNATSQFLDDDLPLGIFIMGPDELIEASRPLCPQATYAKAYTDAYDIYSSSAGKIKGIEEVLHLKNLEWENVIAFGDAANDRQMLEKAAIGVAMGNAPENIKKIADYVTTDIEDDGIMNAVVKLGIIQ